ncbi:MAG TPA: cytochrome c peroxidase [Bdellovibrionota bacterium]|nr:cytochrome c peroxidase [Bdellovibrionota bacterium]
MKSLPGFFLAVWVTSALAAPDWEKANPIQPLPKPPLGIDSQWSDLKDPPTPESVRLGRWLFFDKRLSADGTISCASCHVPEHAFSERTPVSTGIRGQKGGRKAPSFVNQAWALYPNFFWDGRASSLETQAGGPMENPIEMGNTHAAVVNTCSQVSGYKKYFKEAFGSEDVSIDRIKRAIADYERTRMSGNSAYDRFIDGDKSALSAEAQTGMDLFFGKAECNQCHLGQNLSDSLFHNLGIGWNPKSKKFADQGRIVVSKKKEDLGAFKTPTVRDVTKHPPYMHDGSIRTLREVVDHYNKGGHKNPQLSPKIRPLHMNEKEVAAIVAFMESLDGEGYMDKAPASFPQ